MVASRLMPVVLTPGRNVTAFSALRVGIGILLTWSTFSVDETVAVCVFTSSLLLCTLIVSSSWPTSSTALTAVGVPGCSRTSLMTAVLKPCSETVTV